MFGFCGGVKCGSTGGDPLLVADQLECHGDWRSEFTAVSQGTYGKGSAAVTFLSASELKQQLPFCQIN